MLVAFGIKSEVMRLLRLFTCSALAASLICSSPPGRARASTNSASESKRQAYDGWIRDYTGHPPSIGAGPEAKPALIVITAIEGEDTNVADRHRISVRLDYPPEYGGRVLPDGKVYFFGRRVFNLSTAADATIPKSDLGRLKKLIRKLPSDHFVLPPPGRRLVVQVSTADGVLARVYDRANLPERILEILPLIQLHIRSWILKQDPQIRWSEGTFAPFGKFLYVSRGSGEIITAGQNGYMTFWDIDSHSFIKDIDPPVDLEGLSFSPGGSIAVVQGAYWVGVMDARNWTKVGIFKEPEVRGHLNRLFNPQFTPDGRYFLLQTDQPALRIYDRHTWQRVELSAEIPRDATSYFPAMNGERAVYASKSGAMKLWDPISRRDMATLDKSGMIISADFSPDDSLVAIASMQRSGAAATFQYRMRVWRSNDGKLLHEMRVFEGEPSSR